MPANRTTDHRFAQLLHALDHVRGAWRLPIPARNEDVSSLGHLVLRRMPADFPNRSHPRGRADA
jgi:hypothetical protein